MERRLSNSSCHEDHRDNLEEEGAEEDEEMAIPINSRYAPHVINCSAPVLVPPRGLAAGHCNIISHDSINSNGPAPMITCTSHDDHQVQQQKQLELDHHVINDTNNNNNSKKDHSSSTNGGAAVVVMKYKECLKNHAASMGGNVTDGCGEFMPSGEDGSLQALICSACNCHRNFHRKQPLLPDHHHHHHHHLPPPHHYHYSHHATPHVQAGRNLFSGPAPAHHQPPARPQPLPHHHHHHHQQMLMSYNSVPPLQLHPSELDHHDQIMQEADQYYGPTGAFSRVPAGGQMQAGKKRFRTKFTPEQKEKMLNFAHKAGWKMQKQEESVVQQLCQELGIKRRVLKVWMHNNKHNHHLIPNNTNGDSNHINVSSINIPNSS